jgi:hypothetical protein
MGENGKRLLHMESSWELTLPQHSGHAFAYEAIDPSADIEGRLIMRLALILIM